ncbi:MAG: regulatory protein GemA [Magnetospirillum sp.]|nr:regulatory protein GemA [Magnetospirillum sp.]
MTADVNALRRAWFAACREAKIDDDGRKAIQERVAGKASATEMTASDFNACLTDLKTRGLWKPQKQPKRAGSRPLADSDQATKMRALWLALYHLGAVRNPEEMALAAFVQRQTRVSALQWLTPAQANVVIETLKDWCRREGFVVGADWMAAKRELLRCQWAKLAALGAVRTAELGALDDWFTTARISPHTTALGHLDINQLDQAAEKLGAWVRRTMAR